MGREDYERPPPVPRFDPSVEAEQSVAMVEWPIEVAGPIAFKIAAFDRRMRAGREFTPHHRCAFGRAQDTAVISFRVNPSVGLSDERLAGANACSGSISALRGRWHASFLQFRWR